MAVKQRVKTLVGERLCSSVEAKNSGVQRNDVASVSIVAHKRPLFVTWLEDGVESSIGAALQRMCEGGHPEAGPAWCGAVKTGRKTHARVSCGVYYLAVGGFCHGKLP